jgi:DNA-binding IclR family transcriptional regulator
MNAEPRPADGGGHAGGAHASPHGSGTQVVDRVFDILDAFASSGPRLTVTEVSRQLGLKYATAHRLLDAMARRGVLLREPDSRRYRLGPRLGQLAARATGDDLATARMHLEALMERTGETTHLAIREGSSVIYVDSVMSGRLLGPHRHVGQRMPLHSTGVGKVLTAFLDPDEVRFLIKDGLPALTHNTIVDPERLMEELGEVRRRGYAVDDEETEEGLVCVAAPVRDRFGRVIAAVSLGAPASRLKVRVEAVAREVVDCATELSRLEGFPTVTPLRVAAGGGR